jgi:N6-adenosine-specific RNA methylase IME4
MTTIAGYEVHPAAAMFPMMTSVELAELVRDVTEHGQRLPVVMHQGLILDGRNRLRACSLAGVTPKIVDWDGQGGSAVAYVVSVNLQRRHMTESQRAMVAADLLPLFEAETTERRNSRLKRGDTAPEAPLAPRGAIGKAAKQAAEATSVGTRSVERAKAVAAKAPELAERVRAGETTLKQAEKTIKRAAQVQAVVAYTPPEGRFNVIVADPPWKYEKRAEDVTSRGHTDYPTSGGDDVVELTSRLISDAADEDCILWLWVTNAHLLEGCAHAILKATGFQGKTMLTWAKDRMGVGDWLRGQTEHAILAVRGKPMVTLSGQSTLLAAARREHSRKPDAFFALVEGLCPAPRKLELFARASRAGWVTSGAEAAQFDELAAVE